MYKHKVKSKELSTLCFYYVNVRLHKMEFMLVVHGGVY